MKVNVLICTPVFFSKGVVVCAVGLSIWSLLFHVDLQPADFLSGSQGYEWCNRLVVRHLGAVLLCPAV